MYSIKRHEGHFVPAEKVEEVLELFERGLYMQAYERTKDIGPLTEWRGAAALVLGGRLAANLGAWRLGRWMHALAWASDRKNAEAAYFRASDLLHFGGAFTAWRFLERLPADLDCTDRQRGNLLSLRGRVLSQFRDFETAERLLGEAEAAGATPSWLLSDRASLLEKQDDLEGALEVTREALRIRPWFRPGVQMAGNYLQLLGRDDEARGLLAESLEHVESGAIAGQLGLVEFELGLHRESLASFARTGELYPLRDEPMRKWLAARMADAHYHCEEFAEAAANAREVGDPFYTQFAERLSEPGAARRRVHLPVGFVRQHHMTCAPATLSALSRYWNMPVDHLALAAEICYDGTPLHVERHWAEQNGYVAREFRVTWEAAVALLDRGLPFTLTTTETASSHLQAVIGYDATRGTIILRDPYQRIHGEFSAATFLQNYAPFGPRGMVLAPAAEESRLEGLELPDTEQFDGFYRIMRALLVHDRETARNELEAMERLEPAHRLTIYARKQFAMYDGNLLRHLQHNEELLAMYPQCGAFLLEKLTLLRQLGRRTEAAEYLHGLIVGKTQETLFWREWAGELQQDARELSRARLHAVAALRRRPEEAESLSQYANLLWNEREFEKATELYRLAACARDKVEQFSRSYFLAARHIRKTETALDWLRSREQKFGRQSSQPARLLFWALSARDQTTEAFEGLERAIGLRPDDPDLLLFAADAFARSGNRERAEALLAAAESRAARTAWLRTAAALAGYRSDLKGSLETWRQILEAEPLAADAQQATTRLIAEVEGRAAARAHLRESCGRFPYHVPLHRLWIEWMRDEGAEAAEAVIRQTLALDPKDAWVRRELAMCLANQRRFEEAAREADAAMKIDPANAVSYSVLGYVALQAGSHWEARAHCRDALKLSIDNVSALRTLLDASESFEQKRDALAFLREELIRQVVFGDGLISYREAAFTILDPPELLANLREAYAARPDLWHAWSALTRQLLDMRELDEALTLAQQGVERFPLLPRLWFDLALVRRARRELEEEIAALRRALQINPAWGEASRLLANACSRKEDREEERKVLTQAIAAAPLDPLNRGTLASLLWRTGNKDAAVAELESAIRMDPGYDWGWSALRAWLTELKQSERIETLARELTVSRPGEARSWFRLAQSLAGDKVEERIAAVVRAIELGPRVIDFHDFHIILLADAGRFDEAAAACAPAAFEGNQPRELAGRAAWIYAKRGDMVTAVEKMREVVKRWPDYTWGWSMIAEWLAQQRNFAGSLEAARTLARLAPRSTLPLNHMAHAQLELGDTKAALESLRMAFDLEPTNGYSGYRLFDLQLRVREREAAAKTLGLLEYHLPGARTRACRIRLQCATLDRLDALAGLEQLCISPESDAGALREAAKAVIDNLWKRDAEKVFAKALGKPGVNPETGALWVECFTARRAWQYRRRVRRLNPATPLGRTAWVAYLRALGRGKKAGYLRAALRRDGAALRKEKACWGQVGFALASNDQYKEAAKWMRDWRSHRDAEPWMLFNAVLAFRHTRNDAEARAAGLHALTLAGDHTTPLHQVWLACDDAIAGNADSARARLATVSPDGLKGTNEAAYALAKAVLAIEEAPPDRRKEIYLRNRRDLKQQRFQAAFRSGTLRPLAKRGIAAMAAAAGMRPFGIGLPAFKFSMPSLRPIGIAWIVIMIIGGVSQLITSITPPKAYTRPALPPATISTPAPVQSLFTTPLYPGRQLQLDDADLRRAEAKFRQLSASPSPAGTPR